MKVLLLRSGGKPVPDVDTLLTHEIEPQPQGVAEALAFDPAKAWLFVTSRTAVDVLAEAGGGFFKKPFALRAAAGEETGRAVKDAGAPGCLVPPLPGAGGIAQAVSTLAVKDRRILWPRGSDADPGPFASIVRRGALLTAPVVYAKRAAAALDPAVLEAFRRGDYGAVAVSSIAAANVFMAALGNPAPADLPAVKWGVLGPETARTLVDNGFPEPLVPERPRITDLIDLLKHVKES